MMQYIGLLSGLISLICTVAAAKIETHAAVGSRVELNLPINPRYSGSNGALTLTDGVTGNPSYGKEYLGFEGPDVEITVHLPLKTHVMTIAADFLQNTPPAIFLPVSVDFAVSENGTNFRTVATVLPQADEKAPDTLVERFQITGLDVNALAVRVRAGNGGRVPPWHRASQALRWTFISEVLVNPGEAPRSATDLLPGYRFGESRWALTLVEGQLREADAEGRRKILENLKGVLAKTEATVAAKRFCLEQLERCGRAEDVPSISPFLHHEELAAPACRALVALGGEAAGSALLDAYAEASLPQRRAILGALGDLKVEAAVSIASTALTDGTLRPAACSLLGKIGTASAAQALCQAAEKIPAEAACELHTALLAASGSLLEAGDLSVAEKGFDAVHRQSPSAPQQLAALAGLIRVGRKSALPALLEATASESTQTRTTALGLLANLVRERGPTCVEEAFPGLSAPTRAVVLRAVGHRGDRHDEAWVLQQLTSPDAEVQIACAQALTYIGGSASVTPLVVLLGVSERQVREAAEKALTDLPGKNVDAALIEVSHTTPEGLSSALARLLGIRKSPGALPILLKWGRSADANLRQDAWKAVADLACAGDLQTVLAAFAALLGDSVRDAGRALTAAVRAETDQDMTVKRLEAALNGAASEAHRDALVSALGHVRTPQTLAILKRVLADHSTSAEAAVRALAEWSNGAPIRSLLSVAENTDDSHLRILALRSALGLISRYADELPEGDAIDFLTRAGQLAQRPEERQLLIETAAKCASGKALELILGMVTDPALAVSANAALLSMADAMWPEAPLKTQTALTALAETAKDEEERKRAREVLSRIPPVTVLQRLEAEPWQDLFNGRDLKGWRMLNGQPDSWSVKDGLLIARKGGGGWLALTEEYSDYLVEFEFKLPPGGNSGFFLRPPLTGNPAWEGMEVQILDDAAPGYAKLNPAQYCASIYSMGPAKRGLTRPTGEWQKMRILCAGRQVSVWLNGRHAAYADLDKHLDKADKIRGLKRSSGFPGLQNEHGPIEFRGLRIKRLD